MTPVVKNADQAPCGCKWGTLNGAFVFEPCSETCDVYAYAVEQGRKMGRSIHQVDKDTGSVQVAPNTCPGCDAHLDAVSGLSGAMVPDNGSVTICCYCAGVFVFDGGKLRHPRPSEQQSFAYDEELQKAVAMVKRAIDT